MIILHPEVIIVHISPIQVQLVHQISLQEEVILEVFREVDLEVVLLVVADQVVEEEEVEVKN
jgi:hypothetical protein